MALLRGAPGSAATVEVNASQAGWPGEQGNAVENGFGVLTDRARMRVRGLVLSALAVAAAVCWMAPPTVAAPSHVRLTGVVPLSRALRPDGTLRSASGSFDARGYRIVLGRGCRPRFLKVGATTGASGATLISSVPANATFGSATPSQGTCGLSAGKISGSIGSLAAGGSATVSIVLTPHTGPAR